MSGLCAQFCSVFKQVAERDCQQFLILGPENSGKTTLLYRLKFGSHWRNMQQDLKDMKDSDNMMAYDPGYHYEEVQMLHRTCGLWDVPGALRSVWRSWYNRLCIHGVFFVIDEKDAQFLAEQGTQGGRRADEQKAAACARRITEAKNMLHMLMNEDELRRACFTVIINTQQKPHDRKEDPYKEKTQENHPLHYRLGLHDLHPSCSWRVKDFTVDCNRINGEKDHKWQAVLKHVREVLADERSYGIRFRSAGY
mmetsp:Transcript_81007/g.203923  ORF Transcript_81007/g.203923 Transcript_81007/m.203923 type:complete len:252 (-) Transcript_81007:91-846(-)